MKILIIYDSLYGNTEKIAQAIAKAFEPQNEVKMLRVSQADLDFSGINLLILGSPTHGGRPTPAMQGYLKKIPSGGLKKIKIAAFDTRILPEGKSFFMQLIINIFKFAAEKIEKELVNKGGEKTIDSEGFIVEGKEGPLKSGELERAGEWAKRLLSK